MGSVVCCFYDLVVLVYFWLATGETVDWKIESVLDISEVEAVLDLDEGLANWH